MLLDTSSWVEYFLGTEKGKKVKEIIKKEASASVITLGELVNWCLRNNKNHEQYVELVQLGSAILPVDKTTSVLAGRINHERKKSLKNWGVMDSIILATSMIYDLKLVRTDHHFQDQPNLTYSQP